MHELIETLRAGNPVRIRQMTCSKNKVIRVKVAGLSTRIKITKSQTIAIRDNNESFVCGLFPSFTEAWIAADQRDDFQDLCKVVSYMRIRMELRTDIISAAFSDPEGTLSILEMEHETFK